MTKSRNILAPRKHWSAGEEALLRDLYPDVPCADIAALLERKPGSVYSAAMRLQLQKSEHFKASTTSGRILRGQQNPSMIANQFQPGTAPWNKGTHYVAGGRSAETRFKKGNMAGAAQHNYVPIGSLRLSADGYLERKMTDDPTLMPTRRWTAVHRLVWQSTHGPIPAGHVVAFRPGQRTQQEAQITIDRLECISRRELVLRNSMWTTNPELGRLYQLKGAITRQVTRIQKKSESS